MAERGVGISVQAVVSNLGIDPSTVTCTLGYSNQLRYAHAQFGLIARCPCTHTRNPSDMRTSKDQSSSVCRFTHGTARSAIVEITLMRTS